MRTEAEKQWAIDNPEKVLAQRKLYRQRHPKRCAAQTASWRARHPKRAALIRRRATARYRASHPEQVAYLSQKSGATWRGIEFLFTFEEWVEWWGEDFKDRGSKAHKLCMARHGDTGPYEINNVSKITMKQNHLDREARK